MFTFDEAFWINFCLWSFFGFIEPSVEFFVRVAAFIDGVEELGIFGKASDCGLFYEVFVAVFFEEFNEGFLSFFRTDRSQEASLVGEGEG